MKRIEVDEQTFQKFVSNRREADDSLALGRLMRTADKVRKQEESRIALVILEDHWFSFKEKPGQASNAPFLEGVCRMVDNLRSYRLNFYDANSLGHALDAASTVPENRVILYVGAHGSQCRIGAANATNLMKKIAEFSRGTKKIEGILLSSCLAAAHDPSMLEAMKGGTNWLFGYQSSVDFLGSVQVEAAILRKVSALSAEDVEDEDKVIEAVAEALKCFNPDWEIGSEPRETLAQSIRLVTRGKHIKNPSDSTSDVIRKAW